MGVFPIPVDVLNDVGAVFAQLAVFLVEKNIDDIVTIQSFDNGFECG